jgi:hypothetical protein
VAQVLGGIGFSLCAFLCPKRTASSRAPTTLYREFFAQNKAAATNPLPKNKSASQF